MRFPLSRQPSIATTVATHSRAAAGDGWPTCTCSLAVILRGVFFPSFPSHAAHVASHPLSLIWSLVPPPPLTLGRHPALMGPSRELSEVRPKGARTELQGKREGGSSWGRGGGGGGLCDFLLKGPFFISFHQRPPACISPLLPFFFPSCTQIPFLFSSYVCK